MNRTKSVVVAEPVQIADNFFSRLMGLMGKPGLPDKTGLWIVPCSDIHSMFMRFEFDAIFIDKEGKVLHLQQKMKPWRFSKLVWKARAVLELNGGVIEATGTEIGDYLEFEEM
ncbi:MAG: DUF192 domain-containing protein [Cyanobacteria bacterium]|nr:DUF192 domain-containing protein [Cyanobacteriota bacterium]